MQSPKQSELRKSFLTENGSRKDISCTSQLHLLSAEPSSESGTADRPTSAVSARGKTPVGSAAPLTRRAQSADRPLSSHPEVWQQQQQQHVAALPDDNSLVLYKDPSYLSAQESVGSAVSGRFQDGDTFFTALKKDLSFQSDFDTADEQQAGVAGAASFLSCQLNPVQSPDSSAYFSAGGEASQSDAGGDGLQEESSRAASLAACESSYAATRGEASCHDASSGLSPSQSVLDVINSLYCSQPSPAGPGRQARAAPWQQQAADPDGLCLMAAGAAAAPAAAPRVKTAPADAVTAATPDTETADALPAESSAPADKGTSAVALPSAAAATAADAEEPPAGSAGADDSANSDDEAQAESSACLAHVEQLLTAREGVTAELSSYIDQLTSLADEGGQKLVELPADYALMVERRLCECRSEYKALQGWEGLHRFSDLPIAQLPVSHDDPDIAAGLAVIRQLDEQLREVWLKALVTARGSNPEQWAAAERQRLARCASELDEALVKERQRRLHAARLLRALHRLEGPEQCEPDLLLGPSKGLSSYSYYQLQARDEQVLAAVLSRDEADLEQSNPFDASAACLEPDAAASDAAQHGSDEPVTCLDAAGTGDAGVAAEPAAGCADSNGRSSTSGSSLSRLSSSNSSSRGRTLAEIDAQLEALHASGSHKLMRQGGSSSRSSHKGSVPAASKRSSLHSAASSALSGSTSTCQPPDGHASASSIASQARQARDFIREQREAKELAQREHEVDAKLRALRTSELPAQLLPEQLATLLHEASSAATLPLGLPASLTAAC